MWHNKHDINQHKIFITILTRVVYYCQNGDQRKYLNNETKLLMLKGTRILWQDS